jgi:hypothetical protein
LTKKMTKKMTKKKRMRSQRTRNSPARLFFLDKHTRVTIKSRDDITISRL